MVIGADTEFEKNFNAVFSEWGWSGRRKGTIKVRKSFIYPSMLCSLKEYLLRALFPPDI